jgi:hypothetical protein
LKKEHEKLITKANVILTFIDGLWCANDLTKQTSIDAVCEKISALDSQPRKITEKDLDVSIRKLNSVEYDTLTKKARLCEEERQKVLNTPIKDTWLKELDELEHSIYGETEELPTVGAKRNIIDLTRE